MIKKVVLVGSGNLATHLGKALFKKDIKIQQVFSRNIKNAKVLAKNINAKAIDNLNDVTQKSDLYIIAVSDQAIASVAATLSQHLGKKKTLIVHTSGATPQTVFEPFFSNYGVFYPLQTFSKTRKLDFDAIPICVDGNSKKIIKQLTQLGQKVNDNVYPITDADRSQLHVAAVFANNFSNYLFNISKDILDKKGISFDLIRPLIAETAKKVQHAAPYDMQTGPAKRNDTNTIKKHLNLLSDSPDHQKIYTAISQLITQAYHTETNE